MLIVGSGPSSAEISKLLLNVSSKIAVSHRSTGTLKYIAKDIEQKREIHSLAENGVHFVDGSFEEFSIILYCTGYFYIVFNRSRKDSVNFF